jgi:hypothetical protein
LSLLSVEKLTEGTPYTYPKMSKRKAAYLSPEPQEVPVQSKSANERVANSLASDLAYFLQEKGLCDEYVAWYDEMPPLERLLRKKEDAQKVWALLEEGKEQGYDAAVVADVLD